MRIEILNKIKRFADQPSAKELSEIITQFDSSIEEEFFWISSSNHKKEVIYLLIKEYDKHYFINKLGIIIDDSKYDQIHFRILRFLIEVSKTADKKADLFIKLNEDVLFLTELLTKHFPQNKQQIVFFISEIIIEMPLEFILELQISFLTNFALSNNVSYVGSSIIEKFIPRILSEGNGILLYDVLNRLVFSVKAEDYKDEYHRTRYDGYNVNHLLKEENIEQFSKLIGSEKLLDFTIEKIKAIISKVPYNFSYLSISTVEDSAQVLDKDKYEFILVKFLRLQLEINKFSNSVIDTLMNSQQGIFQRLAVYYMNKNYDSNRSKFWTTASSEFLINPEIKHEVFMLLKENSDLITKGELLILFASLEGMQSLIINEKLTKDEIIYYNTLLAKEYLLAFEECKTELKQLVHKKLEGYSEIVKVNIPHPGYNMYFDHSLAVDKNHEEYSETFNLTDLPNFFDIAEGGFKNMSEREALKIVNRINYLFRNNFQFILDNQDRLIKMGLENFYEIPNFFEKAWIDKIDIDWVEVFNFFGKVIDSNYQKNPKGYQHFIAYCAWLIRSTTRDDEQALEGDALIAAKNLCLKFLNLRIQNERLNKDPFFDILNSTDGKIFDATVNVLLRNARINKKKDDKDKWFADIKDFYTDTLDKGLQNDAMIWSISMMLPQFAYLDIDWLSKHINQIFPTKNNELWLLAMRGYHKFCNQVYKVIYDLLLNSGHYNNALEVFKDEQHGTDDVFEHVVMAYVADWKGSEINNPESIIHKVLQNGNRSQVHGLINFFLKNKHFAPEKILELWKAILNSPAVQDKLVYNDLLLLVTNLKTINTESFELIQNTLNNITNNQVLHRLVNSLFEMKDGDPRFIAKVFMEIKESDFEGFYDRGNFAILAKKLIDSDLEYGKKFTKFLIERRLFNLLDVYNIASQEK